MKCHLRVDEIDVASKNDGLQVGTNQICTTDQQNPEFKVYMTQNFLFTY